MLYGYPVSAGGEHAEQVVAQNELRRKSVIAAGAQGYWKAQLELSPLSEINSHGKIFMVPHYGISPLGEKE